MPLKSDREYRSMAMQAVDMDDAEDNGAMIVEGYASTFNQPYTLYNSADATVREQVAPTAFEETDMDDVIMQYDHEGRVFARKRNNTLEVTTDEHGLKIRARLDGTQIGQQLYEEIKGGYTDRMSFGFTVEEDKREETRDESTGHVDILRTITKIRKLYDVSAVSLPANDATEISARSVGEGVIAEAMQELHAVEERCRKVQDIKTLLRGDSE